MDSDSLAALFVGRLVISESEACTALGISRRHALRLRQQRKLGCYEDGRKITYGAHHIKAYLEAREIPAQ